MKKLRKINLASLSKEKLTKREQNRIVGGADCCACHCLSDTGAINISSAGLNLGTDYGYGIGKFA